MKSIISVAAITALTLIASCKKDEDEGEKKCSAGMGGSKTIICTPVHHRKPVQPRSLWVRYNAYHAPGGTAGDYELVERQLS